MTTNQKPNLHLLTKDEVKHCVQETVKNAPKTTAKLMVGLLHKLTLMKYTQQHNVENPINEESYQETIKPIVNKHYRNVLKDLSKEGFIKFVAQEEPNANAHNDRSPIIQLT